MSVMNFIDEELLNIAVKCGVIYSAENWGCNSDGFRTSLRYFTREILERAAEHFDERGKYEDGTWCDGFYDPEDPGEILRALAEGIVMQSA